MYIFISDFSYILIIDFTLHEKDKTNIITFSDLKTLYKTYLGKDNFKPDVPLNDLVIDKVYSIADEITNGDVQLEHKIIMSIAIRHRAEKYMLEKINNYEGQLTWKGKRKNTITDTVSEFMMQLDSLGNQTRELFNAYNQFGSQNTIKVLEEVNIMTPENIHLNSFMYEPILDMDINELLSLYQKVKLL